MKTKITLCLLIPLTISLLIINPVFSAEEDSTPNKEIEELEKKIVKFGKEFEKKMIETIKQMLDSQIQRMDKNAQKNEEENKAHIEKLNRDIKQNPNSAESHFSLGETYDSLGDGANAILSTLKAEELFLNSKDRAGVAKCRRALRDYYAKYDYKPEDFKISQLIGGNGI
jgi:predicted RND superfamily exporter protein